GTVSPLSFQSFQTNQTTSQQQANCRRNVGKLPSPFEFADSYDKAFSTASTNSCASGSTVEGNLATSSPSRFMTNFSKFHLTLIGCPDASWVTPANKGGCFLPR